MSERKNYLHVVQPDSSATIDFASFDTTSGEKVEEVTVKVSLSYNSRTGKAELHVYATTGDYDTIVFDEVKEMELSEADEEEEDENDDEDDG